MEGFESSQEGLDDLLSSNEAIKVRGWKNFLDALPALRERDEPTRRLWPVLHRLVTRGADKDESPVGVQGEALLALFTRGNPNVRTEEDSRAFLELAENYFQQTLRHSPPKTAHDVYLTAFPLDEKRTVTIRARRTMLRRGHLRKWGDVSFDDGEKEEVVAPHSLTFGYPLPGHEGKEYIFLGLAEGLEPLMNELCDRFDELMKSAATVDDALGAMVYFQIWAYVLHPFMDGNGRALAAKLVLDLNKLGIPVKKPLTVPELGESPFVPAAGAFISEFAWGTKMPLLLAKDSEEILGDPQKFGPYMDTLLKHVQKGIRLGVPPPRDYAAILIRHMEAGTSGDIPMEAFIGNAIDRGVELIKDGLSKDESVVRALSERHRGKEKRD